MEAGWLSREGALGRTKPSLALEIGDGDLKKARSVPESLKSREIVNPYRHL